MFPGDDHELNVCIRLEEFDGKIGFVQVVVCLFREDDRMASDIDTLEASNSRRRRQFKLSLHGAPRRKKDEIWRHHAGSAKKTGNSM